MRFSKLMVSICVGLSVSFSYSSAVSANIAEELFDKYALNTPVTANTGQGKVFYGGSFRGRIDRNPIDLIGFQSPTISAGCGGIDFFAGSFSVVSKDEVVQMLRGVAQGVPAYFFNLALSNVCSDCAELATELENRVAELNKWGKMSCEDAGRALDKATGFSEWLDGKLKTEGPVNESQNGLADGPLSFLTKSIPTPASLAEEAGTDPSTVEDLVETQNYIAYLVGELTALDFPYVPEGGDFYTHKKNTYLLLAALGGYRINDVSSGSLEVEHDTNTLDVSTLFEGETETGEIYFYDCVGTAPVPILVSTNIDQECSSIGVNNYASTTSFYEERVGWVRDFEGLMFSEDAGSLGIVPRLRNKLAMSTRQQTLMQMTNFNFVSVAIEQDPILYDMKRDQIVAITKDVMLRDFTSKIRSLLNALEVGASSKKGSELWLREVNMLREIIEKGISDYKVQLAKEKQNDGQAVKYLAQNRQGLNIWQR